MVGEDVGSSKEREARIRKLIQHVIDSCEHDLRYAYQEKDVKALQSEIEDWKTLLRSAPWAPRQFNNADEEKV